jgi:valyl-tRNA synthetase
MTDLPKTYDPKQAESKWQAFWDDKRIFELNSDTASSLEKGFCIVMPPPNVTGKLHMGHALVNTLQDITIRHQRMLKKKVLWVPGIDHAGIATQTVVEKALLKETGKRRVDVDRKTFLDRIWQWKEVHAGHILEQVKRLGCSCDFSKTKFTLDPSCSRAVNTVFKQMYDEGLIYQGDYLVNWDPVSQTALADDEVEYEEKASHLWHIRYPLDEPTKNQSYIILATTRPETLLGDTAIAVHPDDLRYKGLVGKKVRIPVIDRKIPIVADNMVDPEFGSGVVKITPAHDPNDYELGMRHALPMINIMEPDGTINDVGGKEFKGLSMEEAREKMSALLKAEGLLEKIEPHMHRVGVSYRSKAAIEPYLSKQWFVDTTPFKERLIQLVESDEVELIPKAWKKTYLHWIKNLRPWCISRQLWWGHRIPVWSLKKDPAVQVCSSDGLPPPEVQKDPDAWEQDPDVLDTWFSSALWPFSALGWPDLGSLCSSFYPNALLITGHDILFFWVARMIMMGDFIMKKPPFPKVFLHGLIYGKSYWRKTSDGGITYVSEEERRAFDLGEPIPKDVKSKWEKMSKSKGNVIDPIEVIDAYGCDAVRMALSSFPVQNSQIDLDRRRFEEFKNFSNKIWNGARFVLMNLGGLSSLDADLDKHLLEIEDHWILQKANQASHTIHEALKKYQFDVATLAAYEFFWNELCADYVEIVKPTLFGKRGTPELKASKQKVLFCVFLQSLEMLSCFAPFITEELFQKLKETLKVESKTAVEEMPTGPIRHTYETLSNDSLSQAYFPLNVNPIDPRAFAEFETLKKVIFALRNIRGEMNLTPKAPIELHAVAKGLNDTLKHSLYILQTLCSVTDLHLHSQKPNLAHVSQAHIDEISLFVPMPKEIIEREKVRLSKEKMRYEKELESAKARLGDASFLEKAPLHVQENLKKRLEHLQETLKQIEKSL